MQRLLIVTTVPSTLECFMIPFARHFRERGWRVDGAAQNVSKHPACVREFDRVWDIQWARDPFKGSNMLAAPRMIREIVEREGYDLVHVHTPVAGFVTRCALRSIRRKTGTKVVYTAHGFHFYRGGHRPKNALFIGLEKLAGRWTDRLVVINSEDEDAARRYRLVPEGRINHIPASGVDFTRFCPEAVSDEQVAALRTELGIAPDERILLMTAAFIPRKRHWDAIRAFALLDRHDVHLVLAGDGPLMKPMATLAGQLGVEQRVHFLDHREDIPVLIKASTATLLPSSQEGLSGCVTESLGMEVPVIGSDVRGIRDLLRDGRGYLAKLGDVEGFARAMAYVLDHPEEALASARLGREYAKMCDVRSILMHYEALYNQVLSDSSETPGGETP